MLTPEWAKVVFALYEVADIAKPDLSQADVTVINPDTGSLRSAQIGLRDQTRAVSSCAFHDGDGVYVEVILFVYGEKDFGELYIWKVDDSPVNTVPSMDALIDFCKI